LKKEVERGKKKPIRNGVKGEDEEGGWRRMTDSCGDRLVSLCVLWAESTGKF